jgi:hypothetical protein
MMIMMMIIVVMQVRSFVGCAICCAKFALQNDSAL